MLDGVHRDASELGIHVTSPQWLTVNEGDIIPNKEVLAAHTLRYPVMVKSTLACGSAGSHQMGLVCNDEGDDLCVCA